MRWNKVGVTEAGPGDQGGTIGVFLGGALCGWNFLWVSGGAEEVLQQVLEEDFEVCGRQNLQEGFF